MAVTVRPATLEDIPGIIDMGVEVCEESPFYKNFTPDYRQQYSILTNAIQSINACVFVCDDLTGFFIGHIEKMPWFAEIRATEDVLFVTRHKRMSRRAKLLLLAFLEWAASKQVRLITAGVSTGIHAEQTASFYKKFGFSQKESTMTFVKES